MTTATAASEKQASEQNPAEYTAGLGELINAARTYIGISKLGMAVKLGMRIRSYQRIENGDDECPPGLLDTIDALIAKFDAEVEQVVAAAEQRLAEAGNDDETVVVSVSSEPREEWSRLVVGRAAVTSGLITPIIVG